MRLFRYTRVNDEHSFEWLRSLINERQLYCCSIADFNDPFDGRFELEYARDLEHLVEHGIRHFRTDGASGSYEQLRQIALSQIEESGGLEEMNRKARHAIWEQIEHRMGVCCFTQHPDNLLMWGHYGDKFRGICQVFDLPESGVGDAFIQDVNYSDEYPHVLLDMGDSEVFSNLTQAVATKAKCWCYEDEYRLIKTSESALLLQYCGFQ